MLDQSMNWKTVEDINNKWGKHLCLKGIMSVADAKRAVDAVSYTHLRAHETREDRGWRGGGVEK